MLRMSGVWVRSLLCSNVVTVRKGGGGIDGAIHNAAGEALFEECKLLPVKLVGESQREVRCPEGQTKITRGYNLPAKCTALEGYHILFSPLQTFCIP